MENMYFNKKLNFITKINKSTCMTILSFHSAIRVIVTTTIEAENIP